MLSGDKLLSIAEKENKSSIRGICDLLFGIVDLFSFILVVLPLYPKQTDGYIFSVNLFAYAQTTFFNLLTYWILFSVLIVIGIVKIMLTQFKIEKGHKVITSISMVSSIFGNDKGSLCYNCSVFVINNKGNITFEVYKGGGF